MDTPNLDSADHLRALRGLRRVNSFSFSSRVFWPTIRKRSDQIRGRALRVLDLACGSGDVAIALATRAARSNVDIELTGWDISPLAVEMATDQAVAAGRDNAKFVVANVLEDAFPDNFDILMCSLFLHHLEEGQAVVLLKKMAAATRGDLLVNDLRRTHLGYWLAWFGCRLLTRSRIVHFDGPTSVAGAYTIKEAQALARLAGLSAAKLTCFWPERFLIAWSRS